MAKQGEVKGWFTINGVHIPILEGESKAQAAQKYINSKHGKEVAKLSSKTSSNKSISEQTTEKLQKYGVEKVDLEKFKPEEQKEISKRLEKYVGEYKTNLKSVEGQGALQGKTIEAGHVDISGQNMKLSKGISKDYSAIDHEFAHTIAGNKYDKIQGQNKEFWKEIDGIKRKYNKELTSIDKKEIVEKSITAQKANELKSKIYIAGKDMDMNHYATTNLDEFMAVSFEFYKTGKSKSNYAKQVVDVIDKYFKR